MKYRQVAKRRRYRVAQITPFWRFPAVGLTAREFALLELLMRRVGEVVSKDEHSRAVLGKRLQMYDRSLDMHVSNIRKKIAVYCQDEKIQTLRGSGYLFLEQA